MEIAGVTLPVPCSLFVPAFATAFTLSLHDALPISPVKVFTPESVQVPDPLFVTVPEVVPITPLSTPAPVPVNTKLNVAPVTPPLRVSVPLPEASIVPPLPVNVIARLEE